jgi:hypothetical protein
MVFFHSIEANNQIYQNIFNINPWLHPPHLGCKFWIQPPINPFTSHISNYLGYASQLL